MQSTGSLKLIDEEYRKSLTGKIIIEFRGGRRKLYRAGFVDSADLVGSQIVINFKQPIVRIKGGSVTFPFEQVLVVGCEESLNLFLYEGEDHFASLIPGVPHFSFCEFPEERREILKDPESFQEYVQERL